MSYDIKQLEFNNRSEFMDNDMRENFVSEVEKLSNDEHIIGLYDAELEDEIMKNTIRECSLEEGIEQNKKEVIINMLKDNIDINLISKYNNTSIDIILQIKNNIEG